MKPLSKSRLFPDLGVGVGLRPQHYGEFMEGTPSSVQWVEVVTENYLDWEDRSSGRARQILEKVRGQLPVALHGVSMSLGSADLLDPSYLKRLKALADSIEPALVSDHLCWTGVDGINLHDLLPLPFTEEALVQVVDRIRKAQDFLGRRIAIENVSSYMEIPGSALREWEFLSEVSERADCGILLDVNNVYVNAHNHGFDPVLYIDSVPAARVAQIHLAGHSKKGNLLIDTHDSPVRPEVWALYRRANERIREVSAMIEWDGSIPAWPELEREVIELARLKEARPWAPQVTAP